MGEGDAVSRASDMMKTMLKPWRNDLLNSLHADWCNRFLRRRNQKKNKILSTLKKNLAALRIPDFQNIGEERLLHKLAVLKDIYWSIINCTEMKPLRKKEEEEMLTDLRNISCLVTHHFNQNVIHKIERLREQVMPLRSKYIPYALFKVICEALGSVIAPEMETIERILTNASLYVSSLCKAEKTTAKCLERGKVELEKDDMEKQNVNYKSSIGENSEGPQDCNLPRLQKEPSQEMEDEQVEDHTVSEEIKHQVCTAGTLQTKRKKNRVKKGKAWKVHTKKTNPSKGRNTMTPKKVNYLYPKKRRAKKMNRNNVW